MGEAWVHQEPGGPVTNDTACCNITKLLTTVSIKLNTVQPQQKNLTYNDNFCIAGKIIGIVHFLCYLLMNGKITHKTAAFV